MSGRAAPPAPAPEDERAVDLDTGVERMMDDRALFARVLERFRTEYRGTAHAVRTAVAAGDGALAVRLAHTLKGAAGMIEARSLHRHALALEQVLRAGREDPDEHIGRMEAELERVVCEIERLLREGVVTASAPLMAPGGEDVVGRLRRLLDAGDGAACDVVRNERAALEDALGAQRLGEVAAAVDAFDFGLGSRLLGTPGGGRRD